MWKFDEGVTLSEMSYTCTVESKVSHDCIDDQNYAQKNECMGITLDFQYISGRTFRFEFSEQSSLITNSHDAINHCEKSHLDIAFDYQFIQFTK